MDQTQAYCLALLNQEKCLEELQNHLHKTEELFRESVKRKNQQLDLLQSEVRRLKTTVAGREKETSDQVEEALGQHAEEIGRLRAQLATRDAEVDELAAQVSKLKIELGEERARWQAEAARAEEGVAAAAKLKRQGEELKGLRDQLEAAQEAASRLGAASREAEEALELRDAELERLRTREKAAEEARASVDLTERELQLVRERLERREQELLDATGSNSTLQRSNEEAAERARAAETECARLQEAIVEAQRREEEERARADEAEAALAALRDEMRDAQAAADAEAESLRAELEEAAARAEAAGAAAAQAAAGAASSRGASSRTARAHDSPGGASASGVSASGRSPDLPRGARHTPAHADDAAQGSSQEASPMRKVEQHAALRAAREAPRADARAPPSPPRAPEPVSDGADETDNDVAAQDEEPTDPALLDLQLSGDATMAATLTAQADKNAAATSCTYTWFRGTTMLPAMTHKYRLTAADVGHEIAVRVTPLGGDNSLGAAQVARSAIVAVPPEVPHKLQEWLAQGSRQFPLVDADNKDRVILFTQKNLKVRDRGGKTTLYKDPYPLVSIEMLNDETSFTLAFTSKKAAKLQLRAQQPLMRDLIYLLLQAFRDASFISTLPRASKPMSHAAALEMGNADAKSGTFSPASSMASDRPPDLAEAVKAHTEGSSRRSGAGAPVGRRTLSFLRNSKAKG